MSFATPRILIIPNEKPQAEIDQWYELRRLRQLLYAERVPDIDLTAEYALAC